MIVGGDAHGTAKALQFHPCMREKDLRNSFAEEDLKTKKKKNCSRS